MLWLVNLGFAAGGTVEPPQPTPVDVTQTPAGKSRRRRYVVAIDGQDFVVEGVEQARELLQRARAIAERQAEERSAKAVKQLKRKPKVPRVRVDAPAIVVSPEIRAEVAPLVADIERLYSQAAVEAELRLLMLKAVKAQQDEDDDEDDLLLLI